MEALCIQQERVEQTTNSDNRPPSELASVGDAPVNSCGSLHQCFAIICHLSFCETMAHMLTQLRQMHQTPEVAAMCNYRVDLLRWPSRKRLNLINLLTFQVQQ